MTAVDVSPTLLAYGRRRAAEAGVINGVTFVEADGLAWLAAGTHVADVALAIGVFDYVDDAARWLAEFGRHSRTLVATFPRPSLFQNLISWQYRRIGVSAHAYTRDQLSGWLAAAGYDNVRILSSRFGTFLILASRT